MKGARLPACLAALVAVALLPLALRGTAQPDTRRFGAYVERLSEAGGDFDTDNLVSNERSYLDVVPALRKAGITGGAYIGVGPDQNFSYIAHIRPVIAFIVDIRRDNLLLHLLFKALFAQARTRAEYLSLLTGRPAPDLVESWRETSLDRIVAHVDRTPAASAGLLQQVGRRIRRTVAGFGVPLTPADLTTIERFHDAFTRAGLSLKFESRGRPPRMVYPTYRELLLATDQAGRSGSFLASEADYQFVRSLQARDLIVPVVGDLGGTHALAAIAELLSERGDRVTAFYVSNVETYLHGGKYAQFVNNLRRLPHTTNSVIIRSTFQASISSSDVESMSQFVAVNR